MHVQACLTIYFDAPIHPHGYRFGAGILLQLLPGGILADKVVTLDLRMLRQFLLDVINGWLLDCQIEKKAELRLALDAACHPVEIVYHDVENARQGQCDAHDAPHENGSQHVPAQTR